MSNGLPLDQAQRTDAITAALARRKQLLSLLVLTRREVLWRTGRAIAGVFAWSAIFFYTLNDNLDWVSRPAYWTSGIALLFVAVIVTLIQFGYQMRASVWADTLMRLDVMLHYECSVADALLDEYRETFGRLPDEAAHRALAKAEAFNDTLNGVDGAESGTTQ